jgi:hypothetical protein
MLSADAKLFSLSDVLMIVNELQEKERKNVAAFIAWNPGDAAKQREKVRDYLIESYSLVYHNMQELAKKRR